MRNHKKIKAIRTKFGISGYGIWVMVLEYLTGNDGNEFEYSDFEFELMSGDFGVSVTEIRDVVDYCIRLELLFSKNGFVNSESLDERLKTVYEKRRVAKSISARQVRTNGKFSTEITVPTVVTVTEMPQSKVKKSKVKKKDGFTPPLVEDVVLYFAENGYSDYSARKAFDYYHVAGWKDSKGNEVKNWKQKMISVWFKDEYKITNPKQPIATEIRYKSPAEIMAERNGHK